MASVVITDQEVTDALNNMNNYGNEGVDDNAILTEAYRVTSILKQINKEKMDKIKNIFDVLKNDGQEHINENSETIKNISNLKNLYEKTEKQNENNMKSFLENYLYVIIKVIAMFVVFGLLYKYSYLSIPFFTFVNIKDKATNLIYKPTKSLFQKKTDKKTQINSSNINKVTENTNTNTMKKNRINISNTSTNSIKEKQNNSNIINTNNYPNNGNNEKAKSVPSIGIGNLNPETRAM